MEWLYTEGRTENSNLLKKQMRYEKTYKKKKWSGKGIRNNCPLFLTAQERPSTNEEISSRCKPKGNSFSHSTSLNCGTICHRMLWKPKDISVFKMELDTFLKVSSIGSYETQCQCLLKEIPESLIPYG